MPNSDTPKTEEPLNFSSYDRYVGTLSDEKLGVFVDELDAVIPDFRSIYTDYSKVVLVKAEPERTNPVYRGERSDMRSYPIPENVEFNKKLRVAKAEAYRKVVALLAPKLAAETPNRRAELIARIVLILYRGEYAVNVASLTWDLATSLATETQEGTSESRDSTRDQVADTLSR
ncbi:MAG: hypothetical protein AAB383_06175 [Patescibacteria group bacterium]